MCSSSLRWGSVTLAALIACGGTHARELRVCADPNNLPFSNDRGEGFENKIVALLARDLDATVTYTWWAQRRGFVRNTLKTGLCDLVPGVPSTMEMLRTTAPYYRSTYVFVTRADWPAVASFDDPVLREVTVGVQLVGDDGWNTPPAHALSRRGVGGNVRGSSLWRLRRADPAGAHRPGGRRRRDCGRGRLGSDGRLFRRTPDTAAA